jgi:hypothetical protein
MVVLQWALQHDFGGEFMDSNGVDHEAQSATQTARDARRKSFGVAREYAINGYDSAHRYATKGYSSAKDYTARGFNAARDYASKGYGATRDYTGKGIEAAREYTKAGGELAAELGENLNDFARKRPWIAIAVTFALGYAVARIVRRVSGSPVSPVDSATSRIGV